MGDYLVSLIRTYVPTLIGGALSWVIVAFGLQPDVTETATTGLTAGVTVLVVAAYYALARWLERRWPWLGGLLLGSKKTPSYVVPGKTIDQAGNPVA